MSAFFYEVSTSVKSVSRDTEDLVTSINQTASSVEQMSRSVQGVAGNAEDLTAAAEQTTSAMNEMAASIEGVAAMSESLASSVEETSTSIEQIARSIQSIAQSGQKITEAGANAATSATQMDRSSRAVAELARSADGTSRRVAREAEEGGALVQKSMEGISRVSTAMTQSATVMRELNRRTGEISGIVDTINLIAERTNLLSLNASIEAARAGDAGRGFAVVAEEIRNLADRCAKATGDIAQIVRGLESVTQEATTSTNEGLRVVDESSRQAEGGLTGLKKILAGVTETTGLVSQITRATDEQLIAGKHVLDAINLTNQPSTQLADSIGQRLYYNHYTGTNYFAGLRYSY